MNQAIRRCFSADHTAAPAGIAVDVPEQAPGVEEELAKYLLLLGRMSGQLKETSGQIESAVVDVCQSFQGIAQRAGATVSRATGFLSQQSDDASGKSSFAKLLDKCSGVLVKILNTTEEAGAASRRAIERIEQMDKVSEGIGAALVHLDQIAKGNKMLAMNARIEAAHAGTLGAGFAVVAAEVVSQTEKSQKVTAQVSDLISQLQALAQSALHDLQQMVDREQQHVEQSRLEVHDSLEELQAAHREMAEVLTGMTNDGASLANDVGAAVRSLQFQDRTSQRIAHVVQDLDTLRERLAARFSSKELPVLGSPEEFSSYTMQEEREVAGIHGEESGQGEVELF